MNYLKNLFYFLLIVLFYSCNKDDGKIDFTFLQINDVYEIAPIQGGEFGGLARVETVHKKLLAENKNTMLFMAGDFLNPSLIGTIKVDGERVRGKQMIEVMNAMNTDLVAFGNHEFDISQKDLQKRLNQCPLGSGALAGTTFPVDRHKIAAELGFDSPCLNSLDAVSDRDFVLELLFNASTSMMHLSRMAEDLIFYNSGEAGFLQLGDSVTSGSSLMPQKKNPDALELMRGKCGRVFGNLQGLLVTMKGLPLAYNKDMQEDKEGAIDSVNQWHICLCIAVEVLDTLSLNEFLV